MRFSFSKLAMSLTALSLGSTVPYIVDRIAKQGAELNSRRTFLPTSFQSKELIVKAGLRLGDVVSHSLLNRIEKHAEIRGRIKCVSVDCILA